jgi:hypothetical protein
MSPVRPVRRRLISTTRRIRRTIPNTGGNKETDVWTSVSMITAPAAANMYVFIAGLEKGARLERLWQAMLAVCVPFAVANMLYSISVLVSAYIHFEKVLYYYHRGYHSDLAGALCNISFAVFEDTPCGKWLSTL